MSTVPALPLETATVLVVDAAHVYDGPTDAARRIGSWAAGARGTALARGEACVRVSEDACADRWLVSTPSGTGWVGADRVAVRVGTELLPDDLGGRHTVDGRPFAPDGSAVPAWAWFGVTTWWEWHEDFGRDRLHASGRLEVPGATATIGSFSGWGSAEELVGAVWRDLDADGRAELLVEISEAVTEVGYTGRRLLVLGPDLRVRLDLAAHDPTRNGLDQDRFGRIRLEGARIVHERVEPRECPDGGSPPPAALPGWSTTCVLGRRTVWDGLVAREEALPILAGGLPIVAFHAEYGPSEGGPPPWVLVDDGGERRWVREPEFEPAWLGAIHGGSASVPWWVELTAATRP